MTEPRVRIHRIYFMIHPTCWAEHPDGPADSFVESGGNLFDWYVAANWEVRANHEQKELLDRMAPNEALVIVPIGSGPAMRDLEAHAAWVLGHRCLILGPPVPATPGMPDTAEPVSRFLEDDTLEEHRTF